MRYRLQVTSKALTGREAEYERWYKAIHMHDVLALPGFLSCQRFRRVAPGTPNDGDFIAVYEVETDDPDVLLESLFAAAPSMRLTDSIDLDSVQFDFLRPLDEPYYQTGDAS